MTLTVSLADHVNTDPKSFAGAFFDFEALRVYLPKQ